MGLSSSSSSAAAAAVAASLDSPSLAGSTTHAIPSSSSAATALSTVQATKLACNEAAASSLTNGGSGGGGGGSNTASTLTRTSNDALVVLLALACVLLVLTTMLLITSLRLLKHVAAAAAAVEGGRVQNTHLHYPRRGEAVEHVSSSLDHPGKSTLHAQRRPLGHHVQHHGGARHRRSITTTLRSRLGLRDARRIPLGISPTTPTTNTTRSKKTVTLQRRSKSHHLGNPAARERHQSFPAPACPPSSPALLPTAAIESSSAHAAARGGSAQMEAAVASLDANHRSTPYCSCCTQPPPFTATTEEDTVVYNTTHESRYSLLRRIGVGAFSSVYLVRHKTTGKKYALKYILCQDDRQRQAALRECDTMHRLQGHPQVIRIVDMFMSYQFQNISASPPAADDSLTESLSPSEGRGQQAAIAPTSSSNPAYYDARAPLSLRARVRRLDMDISGERPAAASDALRDGHVDCSRVSNATNDPRESRFTQLQLDRLNRSRSSNNVNNGRPCNRQHARPCGDRAASISGTNLTSGLPTETSAIHDRLTAVNAAKHEHPGRPGQQWSQATPRDDPPPPRQRSVQPLVEGYKSVHASLAAATATTTTTHHCRTHTTRGTTVCSRVGASWELGRLDDAGDGAHSRGEDAQTQGVPMEMAKPALQPRANLCNDCCFDGRFDSHPDVDVKTREKGQAELRSNVKDDDGDGDDTHSSTTNSSGSQEEPIQPIHRTTAPPLPSSLLCTHQHAHAPVEGGPTAHNRYSNLSTASAGDAPALVGSVMTNDRAALSPVEGGVPAEAVVGSPPGTASHASPVNVCDMTVMMFDTPTPLPSQQPRRTLYAPQHERPQQPQHTQSMSSSVASYAPLRATAPSEGLSSDATSSRSVKGSIQCRDSVQTVSHNSVNGLAGEQAHQQPVHHRDRPAPRLYGAVDAGTAEKGAAVVSAVGLTRNPETCASVNPDVAQALGGEAVPLSRTAPYAPGGGVRHSALVVVSDASALETSSTAVSQRPVKSGSGTDTHISSKRKASGNEWSRSEMTTLDKNSQHPSMSAPVLHSAECLTTPQSLASASPAPETAVRHTYAPLRYGNLMQTTSPALPATSDMKGLHAMSQTLPRAFPAAIPAARAEQREERMGLSSDTQKVKDAGTAPCATVPSAQYREERLPASGSTATPQHDASSPMKTLYMNLGLDPAGPSTTAGSSIYWRARPHPSGAPPPSPQYTLSNLHVSEEVSKEDQYSHSEARQAGTASYSYSSVRYTNAGNPKLWKAYNADTVAVDSASAAAVAALMGVPPKISAEASSVAAPCAGAADAKDRKSSRTTSTATQCGRRQCSSSNSSVLENVRDTGYLCLVMEYHPMGDLCRYALRTKDQLERSHHHEPQSRLQPMARSRVLSMTTSHFTHENATDEHSSHVGPSALGPSPPPSSHTSSLSCGAATAASPLAATAAATGAVKPATNQTGVHPALSAGAGGGSGTSRSRIAAGADSAEHAHDFDPRLTVAAPAAGPTSDNPLTEPQLLSIAYQLASALDHMHRQNPPVIHRDLKPENILIKGELSDYLDVPVSPPSTVGDGNQDSAVDKLSVSPQPLSLTTQAAATPAAASASLSLSPAPPPIQITRAVIPIVLTDFGLAIPQDTRACPHRSRGGGTRPYIAPECWHGGTCTASDVWSLGCVLYALATCRLVAKDVRIMSQEAKQYGFASRMLNDIMAKKYSLALASFVVSLLVVDPAKRPTAWQVTQCFCVVDGEVRFDFKSPFFSNVLDL